MASSMRRGALNLIFDADDTLWDSNIHFLEAEATFIETLGRVGVTDLRQIRAALRRHELSIIETHGYGRRPYAIALQRVIAELASAETRDSILKQVALITERLLSRHCELLPGVEATLPELARRHRLLLFTKGQPDEQMHKLDCSGLRPLFSRIGIPIEKDPLAYRLLVAQAEIDPADTVMIGNSPRSDINPALKAGLRAVYIPYPHTWELEHEELEQADGRLMTLSRFPHLLEIF
ncbi:MAG: HAD family hydrolase [Candidatus Binataceae bacterium]